MLTEQKLTSKFFGLRMAEAKKCQLSQKNLNKNKDGPKKEYRSAEARNIQRCESLDGSGTLASPY